MEHESLRLILRRGQLASAMNDVSVFELDSVARATAEDESEGEN